MDHLSYQHINNWTNVGPTLHTKLKVANFHVNMFVGPTLGQHYMSNRVLATFFVNMYYNGPTLGQHCKPNMDWQAFMPMYHTLDQCWANNICPTKYWPRFMPTFTTMVQHWANIAYPTPTNNLSCQHIICWTNVGPTFNLRRQQSTNHPTNNQRWPDAVLLSGQIVFLNKNWNERAD